MTQMPDLDNSGELPTDGSLNFIPRMDAVRLMAGYRSILRTIYSSGEYYQRALNCLERVIAETPEPRSRHLPDDLLTLVRIIVSLGILDSERSEFWRYLRRVMFRHRDKFAEAMRLDAMGHHLRKLTGAGEEAAPSG